MKDALHANRQGVPSPGEGHRCISEGPCRARGEATARGSQGGERNAGCSSLTPADLGPQSHFCPQARSSLGLPDTEGPSEALRSPLLHHIPSAKVQLSYPCPQLSLMVPSAHCVPALHQGHSRAPDSSVPALSPRSSPSNRETGTVRTQVMTHSALVSTGGKDRIQRSKVGRTGESWGRFWAEGGRRLSPLTG